ncbi:MAG: Trehalose utilization, partial [Verrucomicrobiota bacterium]
MFYTAGGHTKESFAEPEFVQHVNGGLLWTLGK